MFFFTLMSLFKEFGERQSHIYNVWFFFHCHLYFCKCIFCTWHL